MLALAGCSPHPPQFDWRLYGIRLNPFCLVNCRAEIASPATVGDHNGQDPEPR